MKAKAWRLYGAADARLEDIELEGAGEEGIAGMLFAGWATDRLFGGRGL